jgi:hypothetical protein
MNAAYFNAAVPEPFRILGLSLKPLSLGRYRLLKRFDCAFVADENRMPTFSDLILGLLICSMRCDEFLAWAESDAFMKDVRRWGRKVSPKPWIGKIPWLGKWWREKHSFNVIHKMRLFKRYIDEAQKIPAYWDLTGGGATSASHWSQGVEVSLRAEVGWDLDEINEAPLSKALADHFKFLENKGAIQLISDEEMAQAKANAEVMAKFMAASVAATAPGGAGASPAVAGSPSGERGEHGP